MRIFTVLRLVALAAVLTIHAATARAEEFVDGLAAYDAGDYASAATIWSALAGAGDARAQMALAGLHRQGLGVGRDTNLAISLYRDAAAQGSTDAQRILGDLHARGLLVPKDPIEAFALFGLAAANGDMWSAGRQDDIASTLTPARRRQADARLIELQARWPEATGAASLR